MKKITTLGIFIASLFVLMGLVVAAPPLESATLETPGTTRTLLLPQAADNSNVISLGTALDPGTGKVVEGLAIIHRKDNAAKPSGVGPRTATCYTYLAKDAKWKSVESWVANLNNTRNLDQTTVFNLLVGGVAKWEDATDGVVGNSAGVDILGSGSTTTEFLVADTVAPDNKNEVYFAGITDSNAIAVTIVWGIFGGAPSGRQLVEWDQVYDDTKFDWSAESVGVPGKMDFDNIATHELGHGVGMGDLYNTCIDETMYGYSSSTETKKRDLNTGDITGINSLY